MTLIILLWCATAVAHTYCKIDWYTTIYELDAREVYFTIESLKTVNDHVRESDKSTYCSYRSEAMTLQENETAIYRVQKEMHVYCWRCYGIPMHVWFIGSIAIMFLVFFLVVCGPTLCYCCQIIFDHKLGRNTNPDIHIDKKD